MLIAPDEDVVVAAAVNYSHVGLVLVGAAEVEVAAAAGNVAVVKAE